MAKSSVFTASGLCKTGTGNIYHVNITKAGSGDSSVIVYDNTTNSGTVIWQGGGSASGNFLANSFDLTSDGTQGSIFVSGVYVAISGTTTPIVNVVFD
jgi:hypothetical protein